ncbi:HNH endonuclease family protein [Nocardioides sp. MAHUQ-72]|uniref:HNH endonuclease family protein n=1 Tax=unclassified Nocardioides TaxID=2615069 RepID=UPI003614636E
MANGPLGPHPPLGLLGRLLGRLLVVVGLVVGGLAVPAAASADSYSAPLRRAVSDLRVASEVRTGYDRDLFPHWVDADGDGCSTRNEVLIAEADDPVTVGAGCSLSGGRWFSYYDRVSWTDTGRIDIDHMVPLAEAWDSGARRWRTKIRQAYANDLGDGRTLVGVTDSVNQSKGDQDPAEWMPDFGTCRYVREWVAVKHRWRLSVDRGEKAALASLAADCTNTTITVELAR